jgi:hypothetical protein
MIKKEELEEISFISNNEVEIEEDELNQTDEHDDGFLIKEILLKNKNQSESEEFDFNDPMIYKKGISKYKDLKVEIENGIFQYKKDFVNLFRLYDGLEEVPEVCNGMIVNGYITNITPKEIIVNIGNKDNVIIERKGSEDKVCKHFNIGTNTDILITKVSDNPYFIKGSIEELVKIKVFDKMKTFFEMSTPIEAIVNEIIPAGYMLSIFIDNITIDAFMPNTLSDVNKLHDNNSILGQTIFVMLETLQQDKGVYVVSRKKYLKTLIPEKIKGLKKTTKR